MGNILVFDVGGATTDIHSVTDGSGLYSSEAVYPEPDAKRTVEGDLGIYVNRSNILELAGESEISRGAGCDKKHTAELVSGLNYIPSDIYQERLSAELSFVAVKTGLERHAGKLKNIYSIHGKQIVAEGKDLSSVGTVIGTGGALSRLPEGREILERLIRKKIKNRMVPDESAEIIIDRNYIMASLGVLSKKHPEDALKLLMDNFRKESE